MSHPYTSPEASFSTGQVDECVNLPLNLNRVFRFRLELEVFQEKTLFFGSLLPILAQYARMLAKHKDLYFKILE